MHVKLTPGGEELKGRLVGAFIPLAGARVLGKQFRSLLEKAERR